MWGYKSRSCFLLLATALNIKHGQCEKQETTRGGIQSIRCLARKITESTGGVLTKDNVRHSHSSYWLWFAWKA